MANHVHDMNGLKRKYPTATFVKNWTELALIPKESKTHILEIEEHCAWLSSKTPEKRNINKPQHKQIEHEDFYLSTHTFYGQQCYISSTETLQRCGFNVILDNWDADAEEKKSGV